MRDSADERSKVDRTEKGTDAARDAREEYTSYREEAPEKRAKDEAAREADLQPGPLKEKRGNEERAERDGG